MFKGAEFSSKDGFPAKDEDGSENEIDKSVIETMYVGEPGVDQHLVAEAEASRRQMSVERLKTSNVAETIDRIQDKVEADAKPGENILADKKREVRDVMAILRKLVEENGPDQLMSVKEAPGFEVDGEKFTITKDNEEAVRAALTENGYTIWPITKNVAVNGFRATKGNDENKQDQLVFFFSKEKK